MKQWLLILKLCESLSAKYIYEVGDLQSPNFDFLSKLEDLLILLKLFINIKTELNTWLKIKNLVQD